MFYIKQELHSYICSRVAKPCLILSQQAQGVTATLIQNRDVFFFLKFCQLWNDIWVPDGIFSHTRLHFFRILHCHIFLSNWLQQHAYLQLKYIDAPYFICNYLYFSAVKSYYSLSVTGCLRVITIFTVFRLLTDFVCLYNYEFWLSLCKIIMNFVITLIFNCILCY